MIEEKKLVGWVNCLFSDVIEIISGKNQKLVENPNGQYPIYGSGGIMSKADQYLCEAGTTIIGRKGTINSPIYVSERFWNVDTAFGLSPFGVHEKLFYYYCASYNFKKLDKSTTIPSLAKTDLLQIKIPLPPLAEQHRIVAKIEELFSDLDKGIETLITAKDQLKVYRQAVLKYAFEGRLTNPDVKDGELPEGWELITIGQITENLSQGWSPKCENRASNIENEWAVITTTAIQHIKFNDCENKVLPKDLPPRIQHELIDGDVLITRAGPRNRVGVCCLVTNPRKRLLNCDKAYRIKVNKDLIIPAYLVQVLNTSKFLLHIDKCKSGGNDSGLNLTQSVFLSIQIPLPVNLNVQQLIIQEIESRLSICDKIEESIEQGLHQAEALRQSILKKAFEGKLVPQDPNDEPAHVLLERIKSERAALQPVKKRR